MADNATTISRTEDTRSFISAAFDTDPSSKTHGGTENQGAEGVSDATNETDAADVTADGQSLSQGDDVSVTDTEEEIEVEVTSDDEDSEEVEVDDSETEEADGDEADSETEDEAEDGTFIKAGDSVYKSRKDAEEGIARKDEFIGKQKAQIAELEQALAAREEEFNFYFDGMTKDDIVAKRTLQLLPEEYQGKTEDDFEKDEDLLAFKKAHINAKAKAETEIEQSETQKAKRQEEAKEARKQAMEFVKQKATPDYFGATNPEDREALRTMLTSKVGDHEPLMLVAFVTEAFGEKAGEIFLDGIRQGFSSDRKTAVKKVVKSTKTKPKTKPRPAKPESVRKSHDAKSMIMAGLSSA